MQLVIKLILNIIHMLLIFLIYNWLILFIHEFGHYLCAKYYRFSVNFKVKCNRWCVPQMSVVIRGNNLSVKKDLWVSSMGIIVAFLANSIALVCFQPSCFLTVIVVSHYPIVLLSSIPVGNNDGEYILKGFKKLFLFSSYKEQIIIKMIIISIFIITTAVMFFDIYRIYVSSNAFYYKIATGVIAFMMVGTTYRYIFRADKILYNKVFKENIE